MGTNGPDDYVLSTGQKLAAELISNKILRIFDGVKVYGGLRDAIPVNKYYDLTIDNGTQGKNRNDIVVRRYTKDDDSQKKARSVFKVIKGTPVDGTAVDPEITVTDLRAGALTHDMKLYRVKLEGLNVVAVEPLFDVLIPMSEQQAMLTELNKKTLDIEYPLSLFSFNSFYNVSDFICMKAGRIVYLNASINIKSGTSFAANTIYSLLEDSKYIPEEIRPQQTCNIDMWGCDGTYGKTVKCSAIIDPTGRIRYSSPSVLSYFKIGAVWIV